MKNLPKLIMAGLLVLVTGCAASADDDDDDAATAPRPDVDGVQAENYVIVYRLSPEQCTCSTVTHVINCRYSDGKYRSVGETC